MFLPNGDILGDVVLPRMAQKGCCALLGAFCQEIQMLIYSLAVILTLVAWLRWCLLDSSENPCECFEILKEIKN